MSLDTACFSMNSLISRRIMDSSVLNRDWARALASSVLPTPVWPRKRKDEIGPLGSFMPARLRWMASATATTASCWPTMRRCSSSERCSTLSTSDSTSFVRGMPVHVLMTRATSASVTSPCDTSRLLPFGPPRRAREACCVALIFLTSSPRLAFVSLATFWVSPASSRFSISSVSLSISSWISFNWHASLFSTWYFSNMSARWLRSSFSSISSSSSASSSGLLWGALRRSKRRSPSMAAMRRSTRSSSSGLSDASTRARAPASSTRSKALSGRYLSVMYRSLRVAAAESALSEIRTPWCRSSRARKPRRMDTVSAELGGSILTCWKRRSSAGSFSMNFLNLSGEVAPIHRSSPRPSSGLSSTLASIMPPPC
mmetsp:Transcript_28046/g.75761  ORF Transcript_28046/g.75761 Transcript_28046/m.75761 type:complete len:371 (-) Transcript_28046:984-2096(-)